MILFNIPLLSPANTNDYGVVLDNLRTTLQSILDQTSNDWFVSIGCNDTNMKNWTKKFFPVEKIQITQVTQQFHNLKQPVHSELKSVGSRAFNHSISENLFPRRNLNDGMHDKAFKRLLSYFDVELIYQYIFFLDGDDIVANDLANTLSKQTSDLISLPHGYMADFEQHRCKICNDLNKRCGSTIAYSRRFMENIPLNKLLLYLGGHLTQEEDHPVTFLSDPLLIFRIHEHNFAGNLWPRKLSPCDQMPIDTNRFPSVISLVQSQIKVM